MKQLYLDKTESEMCVSVFVKDAEVIPAGATISSMSVKDKNAEYQRYAEEYDIHFIFDDGIPQVRFYTVPQVDIVATDSDGGFIGMVGQHFDLRSDAPVCYIDRGRKCYLIASRGREFVERAPVWKHNLTEYDGVRFYSSKKDAEKENEFVETK